MRMHRQLCATCSCSAEHASCKHAVASPQRTPVDLAHAGGALLRLSLQLLLLVGGCRCARAPSHAAPARARHRQRHAPAARGRRALPVAQRRGRGLGLDRAAAAVEAHAGRGATTCCAICESRLRPAIAVACPVVKCRMYQRPSRWSGRAVRRQGLVACQPGSVAPCLSRISDSRSEHLMISGVWVRRMAPLWFGGFGGVGVGDITATRSAAKPAGQHANRASRGPRGFNLRDAPSEQRLVPPTFWHSSLAMLKERSERRRKSRRAGEGREGQLCRRHSGGQDADRSGRCARFIRASRVPSRSFSSSDVTRPLWLHVAAISLPRSTESRALPLVQLPPLRATPLQARAGRTFSVTHRREATAEGLLISWPKHGAGLLSSHRRQSSLSSALA